MDTNLDTESYWNRTASKAFSFEDDEEQEDLEGFHRSNIEDNILGDDNVSEASFESTTNILSLTIRSVISGPDLELVLNEQTLESNIIPKGILPDEELKLLRRKLQNMVMSPSLRVTASKLLLGKFCPLEVYKSINDKEKLLDEVLQNGDGDAVIGVILFLHRTLNKKQFYRILRNRSNACDHYINYLIQTKNKEANDILTVLGRHQESAILQFKAAVHGHQDIQIKKQRLKQLLGSYLGDPGMVLIFNQIFTNSLNLIQLIESAKQKLEGVTSVDSSALEVLYACCAKYKWNDLDMINPLSPFKIAADYQISPAQFQWTALNERAKSQSYLDLGSMFEKSSWHSITKQKQFHINFSLVAAVERLADLNAPPAVLNLFLSKMNNSSQRLLLAKKVKCAKGIIDALIALKDVQELENFKDTLGDGTEERFYCEQAIKNITKKWSTDNLKIMR